MDDDEELIGPEGNASTQEYKGDDFRFWHSELDLFGIQSLLVTPPPAPERREKEQERAQLGNGSSISDPWSKSGYVAAPKGTSLADVANAGQDLANGISRLADNPLTAAAVIPRLFAGLGTAVGQGGTFDYQREGSLNSGYVQHREFRDISNVNVGLFAQQAGLTKEQTLVISGAFAWAFSSNASTSQPYHLDERTRYFIEIGYGIGAAGTFRQTMP